MNRSLFLDILTLLTAFGLGSAITVIIQAWLSKRAAHDERAFREKQDAYVGLLSALHHAGVEGTVEAGKEFAYWQTRCELVASRTVREAIGRIVETNGNHVGRARALSDLYVSMRTDLGITS